MRRLRYFTSEGLLVTVGSMHTGSGKKRLYPESALITAVILLRLDEIGATVGKMMDYMSALHKYVQRHYETNDLLDVCRELERPTIVLRVPDRRDNRGVAGRLLGWDDALRSLRPNNDFIVIQVERFL